MTRFLTTLTLAAALAGALALRVAAATRPTMTLSPSSVHRGHVVAIRGNAGTCPVGDTVTIMSRAFPHAHEFAGVPAVLTKVRAGHAFRTSTRIPQATRPGRYVVTARCGGGNLGVAPRLVVLP